MPPLDCVNYPRIGYGHLNIIATAEGTYYYHIRESTLIPKIEKVGCITDLETGLTSECLLQIDLKQLSSLIQYMMNQKGELNVVCSFGFTNQATFKDIVYVLDLLNHHQVRKYMWRSPTQEELRALEERKLHPEYIFNL